MKIYEILLFQFIESKLIMHFYYTCNKFLNNSDTMIDLDIKNMIFNIYVSYIINLIDRLLKEMKIKQSIKIMYV